MLTVQELNEVQGLLRYINTNLSDLQPDDIGLVDSNGVQVAIIGYDTGVGEHVLKQVTLSEQ